jgi:quinol monooxygenase YgiN
MWVRIIEMDIQRDKMDELRRIYNEEIVPIVKSQKGNIEIFLMESQDRPGQVMSFTSWEGQEDGDTYERSRAYDKMVNKIKHTFVGVPTLWSYEVRK